jgi:hypothetical protein
MRGLRAFSRLVVLQEKPPRAIICFLGPPPAKQAQETHADDAVNAREKPTRSEVRQDGERGRLKGKSRYAAKHRGALLYALNCTKLWPENTGTTKRFPISLARTNELEPVKPESTSS